MKSVLIMVAVMLSMSFGFAGVNKSDCAAVNGGYGNKSPAAVPAKSTGSSVKAKSNS